MELITIKAHITIVENKPSCQTKRVTRKHFDEHYLQSDHNGICDWEITVTDHAKTEKSLRQNKIYWYHKLNTYVLLLLMNMMFTLHIKQGSLFIIWL